MQCNCREQVEKKLRDFVEKDLPQGFTGFDAELKGYGWAIKGNALEDQMLIPYRGEVMVPKKSGDGMKRQKIDVNVSASFCPFCGTSMKTKKENASHAH